MSDGCDEQSLDHLLSKSVNMKALAWIFILASPCSAARARRCLPHCEHPCEELNGDIEEECGACVAEEYSCRPAVAFGGLPPASTAPIAATVTAHGDVSHEPAQLSAGSSNTSWPSKFAQCVIEPAALGRHALALFDACRNATCVVEAHGGEAGALCALAYPRSFYAESRTCCAQHTHRARR